MKSLGLDPERAVSFYKRPYANRAWQMGAVCSLVCCAPCMQMRFPGAREARGGLCSCFRLKSASSADETLARYDQAALLAPCARAPDASFWVVPPGTVLHHIIDLNQRQLGYQVTSSWEPGARDLVMHVPTAIVDAALEATRAYVSERTAALDASRDHETKNA